MTSIVVTRTFPAVDLALLRRLAEEVAFAARAGDTIALFGDLGAGKTTFARLLIQTLVPDVTEVPSPTFTLVQTYAGQRMGIAHFDLYRLKAPAELDELGFEEAGEQGLALVEWPERAGGRLPVTRLDIRLGDCADGDVPAGVDPAGLRRVELVGHGGWAARLTRLGEIHDFLVREGFGDGHLAYMQGDASTRRYAVVTLGGLGAAPGSGGGGGRGDGVVESPHPQPLPTRGSGEVARRVVLMDSPRQPDGPVVRDGKPYSQIAHLAEDVRPFVAIAGVLDAAGFSVPRILAHDMARGLLVIEHLGDDVFGALLAGVSVAKRDALQAGLWRAGVESLAELARVPVPTAMPLPDGTTYSLPPYDAQALGIETELIVDWYWPAIHGAPVPADARAEFAALWGRVIDRLAAMPAGWALRDYHSPNLLWLPERAGTARVGIIDFQDAQAGPLAYDVVSLLQDARLDVPAALEGELLDHYCALRRAAEGAGFDEAGFRFAYAALGAQRNTKIVGIFARLSRRDGKHGYLAHIPRIWRYLARDLAHPELAALRDWYDRHLPVDIRARVLSA